MMRWPRFLTVPREPDFVIGGAADPYLRRWWGATKLEVLNKPVSVATAAREWLNSIGARGHRKTAPLTSASAPVAGSLP